MSGPEAWAAPGSALPTQEPAPAAGTAAAPDAAPPIPDRAELLGGDIAFRPLGISEMLDGAITCIRRSPRAVLGLSVAISGVIQVLNSLGAYYFIGDEAREELTPGPVVRSVGTQFTLGLIGLVMSAYGTLLLAGLLAPVLSRTLFGGSASLRQAWRDTRPQLARLIGIAAVVMIVSLLGLVLPVAPFVLLLASDAPPVLEVFAGLVGFPLGLALMVWLYVLLVLAVPAVVLERQTVPGALRRAYQLSRKRWWRTCGTLLLALLITIFMGFLALRIPFLVAQLIFFGDDPGGNALVGALAVDTLGRIVSWSLITPFDAGVIALLYIDRRMRREGFDLDVQTRTNERLAAGDDGPADPLGVWRPVDFPPAAPLPPPPPRARRGPVFPPPPYPQGPPGAQPQGPGAYPQGPAPHPQSPGPHPQGLGPQAQGSGPHQQGPSGPAQPSYAPYSPSPQHPGRTS